MPDLPTTPVVLSDEEVDLVQQLADARKARGQWEKVENELRTRVLDILHERETARVITASGAPAAHLTSYPRRTVNSKKLEALYPEIYEEVVEEREVVNVNIDLP